MWLCIFPIMFASLQAPTTQETAIDLTLDDLAECLDALESASSSMETVFRTSDLGRRPIDPHDPWPTEPWDDASTVTRRHYQWIMHDGLIRIQRLALPNDNSEPVVEASWTWTGSSWYEKTNRVGDKPGLCAVYAAPLLRLEHNCFALFNGGVKWISMVGVQSLGELVRASRLMNRHVEGNTVRFRFSASESNATQIIVVVDTELDCPRVTSVVLEVFGLPGSEFAGLVRLRIAYYVDEWGEYDGLRLPKRAHRLSSFLRSEGSTEDEATVWCMLFERESAHRLEGNQAWSDLFAPPSPQEGDIVQDHTLKLVYVIGSRRIVVDGAPMHVNAPILTRVTDNLPELLEQNGENGGAEATDAKRNTPGDSLP